VLLPGRGHKKALMRLATSGLPGIAANLTAFLVNYERVIPSPGRSRASL